MIRNFIITICALCTLSCATKPADSFALSKDNQDGITVLATDTLADLILISYRLAEHSAIKFDLTSNICETGSFAMPIQQKHLKKSGIQYNGKVSFRHCQMDELTVHGSLKARFTDYEGEKFDRGEIDRYRFYWTGNLILHYNDGRSVKVNMSNFHISNNSLSSFATGELLIADGQNASTDRLTIKAISALFRNHSRAFKKGRLIITDKNKEKLMLNADDYFDPWVDSKSTLND